MLVERGIVDPRRVGISGLSFGAETTHYALYNMKHLTAAIASGPSTDPIYYYLGGGVVRQKMRDRQCERLSDDNAPWYCNSAVLDVAAIQH